jgi:hypothetical protein
MIYLTGDVHAEMENNFEQKLAGCEFDAALKYLKILKKYKISSTLFINGVCFKENKNKVKEILNFDVELGGHTYNNFGNKGLIKSYIYRKIWKCMYGSKTSQRKDINKTINAFEDFGLKMSSWRTHAFSSNAETFELLGNLGVSHVSDYVGDMVPFLDNKIIQMPINIPVDQNTFEYNILKPENRDPFIGCVKGRIKPKEWFEILKSRIKENEKNGKDSIILIHPITMAVLDNFKIFEEVAKFLSKYESQKVSEFKLR